MKFDSVFDTLESFCIVFINSFVIIFAAFPPLNEEKMVKVCISQLFVNCGNDFEINVKNCTNYNVYYLTQTSGCPVAYCFGKISDFFMYVRLSTFWSNKLLAHLTEDHENLCHGAASVARHQHFPLNDFFSGTTRPISTKLGRKHALEMGIQIVQIKGLASFGAH